MDQECSQFDLIAVDETVKSNSDTEQKTIDNKDGTAFAEGASSPASSSKKSHSTKPEAVSANACQPCSLLENACGYLSKLSAGHNLPMIRSIGTPEFNERVWQRLDERLMASLPLAQFQQGDLKIEGVTFQGNYTQISGRQGRHAIEFRLRDWNGDLGIDDVKMPVADQPDSFVSDWKSSSLSPNSPWESTIASWDDSSRTHQPISIVSSGRKSQRFPKLAFPSSNTCVHQ